MSCACPQRGWGGLAGKAENEIGREIFSWEDLMRGSGVGDRGLGTWGVTRHEKHWRTGGLQVVGETGDRQVDFR